MSSACVLGATISGSALPACGALADELVPFTGSQSGPSGWLGCVVAAGGAVGAVPIELGLPACLAARLADLQESAAWAQGTCWQLYVPLQESISYLGEKGADAAENSMVKVASGSPTRLAGQLVRFMCCDQRTEKFHVHDDPQALYNSTGPLKHMHSLLIPVLNMLVGEAALTWQHSSWRPC